ncbi:GGDEF domain-containing protein [Fundidesulfovibrio agrisoli]|uniref:GGDEF domain-containing protein n=1 Tax=Fundidesulfovibrio agrisoli TaxID=2922717 RepID=UPI001FAD93C2
MNGLLRAPGEIDEEPAFRHMDFLPLGILVLDQGMRVRFFNACLEFWSGLRRDKVLGRQVQEVFPNLTRGTVLPRLDDIFLGGPPAVFSYHLHNHLIPSPLPDGGLRLQHGVAYGVKGGDGGVERVILSLQDVTELHTRLSDNLRITRELETEIEARKAMEAKLIELATKDHLTRLDNRRAFFDRLDAEIRRSRRTGQPLALVAMDLDRFKSINDRFGHQVGDEVLRNFAEAASQGLRGTDVLARTGGEEFFIILPAACGQDAARVAERIRKTVEAGTHITDNGDVVRYTVSLGVASLQETMDMYALLYRADQALYAAKAGGRNRVHVDPGEPEPSPLQA